MTRARWDQLPPELMARSIARSLGEVLRTWAGIVLLLVAAGRWPEPWVWAALGFLLGVLIYHLNILGHDGLHYSLADSRRVNDAITRWLLIAPQGMPLSWMRANHIHHHQWVGEARDADGQYYQLHNKGTRRRLLLWLMGCFAGTQAASVLVKLARPRPSAGVPGGAGARWLLTQDFWAVPLTQVAIAGLCFGATGLWWSYFALWTLPLVTVLAGLNSVRSCVEHVLIPGENAASRLFTFRSNAVERFFLSPYGMNHHAEHHHYMTVPWFRLPELRRWMEREQPGTLQFEKSYLGRLGRLYRGLA